MNTLKELIIKDDLYEITILLKLLYRNKIKNNNEKIKLIKSIDTGGCNILNGIIGLLTNTEELILLGASQDLDNEIKFACKIKLEKCFFY